MDKAEYMISNVHVESGKINNITKQYNYMYILYETEGRGQLLATQWLYKINF